MNRVHITKDGKRMFISEMDDTHLQNMIKIMLAGINKVKTHMRNDVVEDKFKTALYGESESYDDEELEEMLESLTTNLYPYLAEIALRGIDMSKELQAVFEREGMNIVGNDTDDEFKLLIDNL